MTKEEAIMNLQHTVDRMNKEKGNVIKELDRNGKTVDILCSKEALEMGIEALKEQKKGKWIVEADGMVARCSACQSTITGIIFAKKWRYCHYCGAKMEAEE